MQRTWWEVCLPTVFQVQSRFSVVAILASPATMSYNAKKSATLGECTVCVIANFFSGV